MKPVLNFGTFFIPQTPEGTASFTVPGIFPKDFMVTVFISKEDDTVRCDDKIEKEVTHGSFFGENISRVKNMIWNDK
jgi:hypothetical protein